MANSSERPSRRLFNWWQKGLDNLAERNWLIPFIILAVVLFFADMTTAPERSLLPVYAESVLKLPPYFTSTLVSVQTIFGAIAAFVGGGLADTLGRKRVLVLGMTALPLIGIVFIIRSPVIILLLWIYVGFALGLTTVGRQSSMMALVPGRFLSTATAIIFIGSTFGAALGNSVAAPVVDDYGFSRLGMVMIIVAVTVLAVAILGIPNIKTGAKDGGGSKAFAGYSQLLQRKPIWLLGALRFFPTSYWGTATLLLPLLIFRAAGVPSASAYYGTASLIFASICQLIFGRICDRYGRGKPILTAVILLATISLITSFFTHNIVGLFICGMLGAGVAWSISVAIPGIVSDISEPNEHGRAIGFGHIAWSAGMLTGTQVGGWLVNSNSSLPFLVMGIWNIGAVVAAIAIQRHLQRKEAA